MFVLKKSNKNKKIKYNYGLIKKLNKEYEKKKIMQTYPKYDREYQIEMADKRIDSLLEKFDFNGKKILEIGCGGGYTIYRLAQKFDCIAVGIDIYKSDIWQQNICSNLSFYCVDLSKENPFDEEEFDYIISYVAWEHMEHPFEVLQQAAKILKLNGEFYLAANLYRSAIASHLYREIYFPFPHLLFDENIVKRFALKMGAKQEYFDSFYKLNKLTYAQYKEYFSLLNLKVKSELKTIRNLDYNFYERFQDKLGCYPISDLELDFFGVYLKKDGKTNLRYHMYLMEITIKDNKNYYKSDEIELFCNAISNCNIQYAWYVFLNDKKIDSIWYNDKCNIKYKFIHSGNYNFIAFIRDKNGNTKRISSEIIIVE